MTISPSNPATGAPPATSSLARSHHPHGFLRQMRDETATASATASPTTGALLSTDMLRWIASNTGFMPSNRSDAG